MSENECYDVTEPCATVQYGLIMLTCGSQKMELRRERKPIGWNAELQMVPFGYLKTEPSDSFLQTPNQLKTFVAKHRLAVWICG